MQSHSDPVLDTLSLGFRNRYLNYAELTSQLQAWATAFPALAHLSSLGKTPEGRDIWLLRLGVEPDRLRPAAWVDGNMHASELAGSSVALGIAEDVLRAHLEGGRLHDLPAHIVAMIRSDVLFYVVPRMSPDGAEQLLETGCWTRSAPRDQRLGQSKPYWQHHDVDGNGRVGLMRVEDPTGDYVVCAEHPNLMLPRRIEDAGPYYRLYPEGVIENFDGVTIPDPHYLSDNETDFNRNFPYQWAPEPREKGAGSAPLSEPETRAIGTFAGRHPNIFVWMNLHTFGGVYIRPPGDMLDKQMNHADFEVFRQVTEWCEQIGGYPMVSGFEEFTYEPDKPLRGDLSAFAYGQRGAIGFVCELWDFFKQAGLDVLRPFVWNYQRRLREEGPKMAVWDRDHNQGRIFQPWIPMDHPQLGPVEVGGYSPLIGMWNPPPNRLNEVCVAQSRVFLRLAALAPRLRVVGVEVENMGAGLSTVHATVENIGYLPTYVLASSKALPWNDEVYADLELEGNVRLVSGSARAEVGHLGGWGNHANSSLPSQPGTWSTGGPVRKRVSWLVRGDGVVRVVASAARVGVAVVEVSLGE